MIKKKIQTISIACFMLLALLTIIPTVQAGQFHIIKGTLYVDNAVMGAGAQIKVDILTNTFTFDTFDPDINGYTFYLGGFDNDIYYGATAYFTVIYNTGLYTPIDNISVILNKNTYDGVENYILDLHIDTSSPANNPPNAPTLVSPAPSGTTVSGTTSTTLKVSVSDPDSNPMDVSFYNANGNVLIRTSNGVSSGSTASYSWTGLSPDTTYSWYVIANDGTLTTQSATWSFKTAKSSSGGGGGGGGGSSGGDSGDDTTADDDDDEEPEIIPNNPPVIVSFTGTTTGTKNVEYSFSVNATDPDGHDISYTFYWADTSKDITEFVPANITYNTTHTWTAAGIYNINVNAIDDYQNGNGTPSGNTSLQVLIDAHIIDNDDIDGYLTDDDADGIYDTFHNNEDGSSSDVGIEDGFYLLDTNGDGEYDYKYDPNTGAGEIIQEDTGEDEEPSDEEPSGQDNTLLYAGVILIIFILLLLFFLATRKKKDKKNKKK